MAPEPEKPDYFHPDEFVRDLTQSVLDDIKSIFGQ
jgi:hypothetical protein